jgi:hypothetical protein
MAKIIEFPQSLEQKAPSSLAIYQDMLRQHGIFKTDEELSAELKAESIAEGTWPTSENIVIHAV